MNNVNLSFIPLFRKITEWEWYKDTSTKSLFLHLVLRANWQDKPWKGILIKRGSYATGWTTLSFETGLTRQQIRTSLIKLKSTSEVTIKSTNKYSVITLTNYEDYQITKEGATSNLTSTSTIKQPSNNHQITTTKKSENLKKEKIKKEGEENPPAPKDKKFKKPSVEEIQQYSDEINANIDGERFFCFYESKGWKVGRNSMKDWKMSLRGWKSRNKENLKQRSSQNNNMTKTGFVKIDQEQDEPPQMKTINQ